MPDFYFMTKEFACMLALLKKKKSITRVLWLMLKGIAKQRYKYLLQPVSSVL